MANTSWPARSPIPAKNWYPAYSRLEQVRRWNARVQARGRRKPSDGLVADLKRQKAEAIAEIEAIIGR